MFLLILLFSALAVTLSHAYFLRSAQAMTGAPHHVRLRLWQKHEQWNGVLWVMLFVFIVISEFLFPRGQISPYPSIGWLLSVSGTILVIWSRLILGRSGAMGIRWFLPEQASEWQKRGPYRIFANPMYDGFVLIFVGLGLWLGTIENFYLATVSFILFNVYLARIESYGYIYRIL